MKHILKTRVLLFFIFISYSVAGSQELTKRGRYWTQKRTHSFNFRENQKLEILDTNGDIEINVWDKSQIEVYQIIRLDVNSEDEARETEKNINAVFKSNPNVIRLGGKDLNHNWINIRYEIHAPENTNCLVKLSSGDITINGLHNRLTASTGAGDIEIMNIQADVKAYTGAGEIEIFNIDGTLNAKTGGGEIDVEKITGSASIITGGGEITASDIKSTLIIESGGGEIDVEYINDGLDIFSGGGDIDINNVSGEIIVQSGGAAICLADVNGNIRAITGGGSIEGRRVAGKLAMSTGGGDIDLIEIKASMEIATNGGDISVEFNVENFSQDYNIILGSGGGDIFLQIPEQFPARIDAEIKYKKRAWQNYEIHSDFPINIETINENHYRIISGHGKINGGGSEIRINTSNGDIIIKKVKNLTY